MGVTIFMSKHIFSKLNQYKVKLVIFHFSSKITP